MNNFIEQIYRKMNVKFKEVKDSINITYDEAEKDVNLASGFERELASLSFMLALSRLQGNDLLLLDEIDAAANDENSLLLYDMLKDLDSWSQLFIISHRQSVKELLINNGATVFELDKGKLVE